MSFNRFTAQLLIVVIAAIVISVVWQSVPLIQSRLLGLGAEPRAVLARGELADDEKATIDLFEARRDSVVYISTAGRVVDPWTRNVHEMPRGTGSGFVWDDLGHVITNAHVVAGAEELTVALQDGTEVPATLVGSEPMLDVAIIKLALPAGQSVPGIAAFGDSSTLRAGDQVIAIGNALGAFPNTVSEGTVNATNRAFPAEGGLTTMIQHDAEIWHGNSGGPLLNLHGEVVGINTAGIGSGMLGADTGSADMAFAVEGNTVCAAAADLLANGEIVWPYLGIQGEGSATGQTVIEVVEDGPSDAAGLEPGDVITALDGEEVSRNLSLLDLLFSREPGDVVALTIERDGAIETVEVTLGERPEITD